MPSPETSKIWSSKHAFLPVISKGCSEISNKTPTKTICIHFLCTMAQQSRFAIHFAPNFGITASLSCSTLLMIIFIMIHTFSFFISFPNALMSGTIQLAEPEISLDIWRQNECRTVAVAPLGFPSLNENRNLTTHGHGFVNLRRTFSKCP